MKYSNLLSDIMTDRIITGEKRITSKRIIGVSCAEQTGNTNIVMLRITRKNRRASKLDNAILSIGDGSPCETNRAAMSMETSCQ
jgi:hypothetical protein